MRNAESARQTALAFLIAGPFAEARPVLLDAETQEFNEGWVYFYQSVGFAETGDISEMLMGNAPVFVPRDGTPPSFVSRHRSLSESMEAFRLSGNPEAQANSQVRLVGWKPGALAVSAIQSIRQHSSLGLAAAKRVIDSCLAGDVALIDTLSVASARELVSSLSKLGFAAEVTYGGREQQVGG